MKTKYLLTILLAASIAGFVQGQSSPDTTINNLVHPPGYSTTSWGAIPAYYKSGKGKKTLIIIPGLGFDGSIFKDFVKSNRTRYTMYVVTLPGFGRSQAPPMPKPGASYGEQAWCKSVAEGIVRLVDGEKLNKPVIVGHFVTGSQVAIRLAVEYSDRFGGLIIVGGSAKMMASIQGKLREASEADMVKGTDTYWAPKWFKHMTKQFYDNGNFAPEVYAINPATASTLWTQVAAAPLHVSVRYACEYYATDMSSRLSDVKCPILVIRPMYTSKFWESEINKNWIQPQFIESWNLAARKNQAMQLIDIPDAGALVWKDKPDAVYDVIDRFTATLDTPE